MITREIIDVPELLATEREGDGENTSFTWTAKPYFEIDGDRITVEEYNARANPGAAERLAEAGRKHWAELYSYIHTPEQLADWETRIPNFGCSCQRDYQELKAAFPPQYHDDELGWLKFEWKSGMHNLVNRKLGKPEKSIDDAIAEWLTIPT